MISRFYTVDSLERDERHKRVGPVYVGSRQIIDYNIGDYTLRRPKIRQLYCRTGYHLIIKADGTVRGTREQYNAYSKSAL